MKDFIFSILSLLISSFSSFIIIFLLFSVFLFSFILFCSSKFSPFSKISSDLILIFSFLSLFKSFDDIKALYEFKLKLFESDKVFIGIYEGIKFWIFLSIKGELIWVLSFISLLKKFWFISTLLFSSTINLVFKLLDVLIKPFKVWISWIFIFSIWKFINFVFDSIY